MQLTQGGWSFHLIGPQPLTGEAHFLNDNPGGTTMSAIDRQEGGTEREEAGA